VDNPLEGHDPSRDIEKATDMCIDLLESRRRITPERIIRMLVGCV